MRPTLILLPAALLVAACADVADPLPPPEPLVLVADSAIATLGVLPTADPDAGEVIPLAVTGATPGSVAPRAGRAAVPLGGADAVALVDLHTRTVAAVLPMPPGSAPAGAAWASDSLLMVSLPGQGRVVQVDLVQGDTVTVARATDPRGLIFTRGRLFVLDANTAPCGGVADRCALGDSRIIVIDPRIGVAPAAPDTIELPGAVNAGTGTLGGDGLVYVVASGDPASPAGRLVVVDPVRHQEVANYGGLGNRPGGAGATLGQVLVASRIEGLLVFDTEERALVRAAGNGMPLSGAVAVTADPDGRIYVAREAACGTEPGALTVLTSEFATIRELPLASCPSAAALALVPPEQ